MKWSIPSKTFLVGEYAALVGAPGIVLTTMPCFEVRLTAQSGLHGIHPESPAGQWWTRHGPTDSGLEWFDPYQGCGGLGASSAQFLGSYVASLPLHQKTLSHQEILEAYFQYAWHGKGLPPSGYDVSAQLLNGCVYIDKYQSIFQTFPWPFEDIAFILLHTGKKLATHHHLQTAVLPSNIKQLTALVEQAKNALEQAESHYMIEVVNAYHQALASMDLVAEHSLKQIELLQNKTDILAIKGCGAMGSDVLLLLVASKNRLSACKNLSKEGWNILATSEDLYTGKPMLE